MSSFTNFSGTVRPLLTDKARQASFDEIPIISLTAPEPELIDAIRDACTRIGFFYVRDHGVSQPTIDRTFEYAKKFFGQRAEEKEEVHIKKSRTMRGWDPVKEPKSEWEMGVDRNGTRKQDQKETFCWAYETALDPDFEGEDEKRKKGWTISFANFDFVSCFLSHLSSRSRPSLILISWISHYISFSIRHICCAWPRYKFTLQMNTETSPHSMRRR